MGSEPEGEKDPRHQEEVDQGAVGLEDTPCHQEGEVLPGAQVCHQGVGSIAKTNEPINIRIARFHNIYGPRGTWKGGREKAPAAFCRKAITSTTEFEMWGDGKQTRSFTFIDDCVEGVLRLTFSDCDVPINLGSTEMVDMNEFARIALSFDGKDLPIKHIDGPMGVRGRNSNNKLILEKLGWEPTMTIADGLRKTYFWIKGEIERERKEGNAADFSTSEVVQQVDDSLMKLGNEESTV